MYCDLNQLTQIGMGRSQKDAKHSAAMNMCKAIQQMPENGLDECGIYKEYSQTQEPHQQESFANAFYTFAETRVGSFYLANWPYLNAPYHHKPTPKALAQAGFYYDGLSDMVTCHNCGLKLTEWKDFEIPIVEHTKFNPMCAYIQCNYSQLL